MIHVLVMANDSVLAAGIVSMLAEEIDLDVVRLTRSELGKGDRYSVVIIVDEGEAEAQSIPFHDLFRENVTMLVIWLSLESRNIYVYESYQLNNPGIDRVIDLVRDFGEANLKKKAEGDSNRNPLRNTMVVTPAPVATASWANN
jgi:hypothetical protein